MAIFKRLEQASQGDAVVLDEVLDGLKFNSDGLLPAIAQQYDTQQVLMMAWVSRESLNLTLQTKLVHYWSRSRQCLWKKGESSGHLQALRELRIDCDGDTLLLLVDQAGPACHTNRPSCFYNRVMGNKVKVS